MESKGHDEARRVSRRDFLFVAAGSSAVLSIGLTAPAAGAANKLSAKAVSYRPTPNGKQRCDNCANWQPPASCKRVDGVIAPSGWCILYTQRR